MATVPPRLVTLRLHYADQPTYRQPHERERICPTPMGSRRAALGEVKRQGEEVQRRDKQNRQQETIPLPAIAHPPLLLRSIPIPEKDGRPAEGGQQDGAQIQGYDLVFRQIRISEQLTCPPGGAICEPGDGT